MRANLPMGGYGAPHGGATGWFGRLASYTALISGKPATFLFAVLTVVVWAVTGPLFHYSDTWQLVINTGTTIVTFLMVFLIQNTQNRDAKAIHLKLDELIRSTSKARNSLVNLENLTDDELANLKTEFEKVQLRAKFRSEHKSDPSAADDHPEETAPAKLRQG